MRINDIEILALSDGELHVPPTELLNKSVEEWKARGAFLDEDDLLAVNFGGFLVRTPDRTIVVDTGIGAGALPGLPIGSFPAKLAEAGVAPHDVTDVIFTHLHFDHIGWCTDGTTAMFPNAIHHCHERDWEHWCGEAPAPETGPGRDDFGAIPAPDRLAPLADRLRRLGEDTEVAPGVAVRLAPGHTPGHCIVELCSGGEHVLLLADVAHHPIELLDDDWLSVTDVDPELARQTRAALAQELAQRGILATMTHDAGNRFGRVVAEGRARRWEPVEGR